MLWWLVFLLAIAFCCSFVAPDSGLHNSALQALDSSVGMLSRAGVEQSATSRRKRAESMDYEPDAEGTPHLHSVRAAPRTGETTAALSAYQPVSCREHVAHQNCTSNGHSELPHW